MSTATLQGGSLRRDCVRRGNRATLKLAFGFFLELVAEDEDQEKGQAHGDLCRNQNTLGLTPILVNY